MHLACDFRGPSGSCVANHLKWGGVGGMHMAGSVGGYVGMELIQALAGLESHF